MHVIIGKNSKIVKTVSDLLPSFKFLSHRDLAGADLSVYDRIFVFSWSHANQDDNTKLLDLLDLAKVVFISTIAVLACARREQWARYPNWKLVCEKRVLEGGGKVIRIGIWDLSQLDDLPGQVPVTTPEALVAAMHDAVDKPERVFWPIELRSGRLDGGRQKLSALFNAVALMLPPKKFFQLPLAFCIKTFVSKDYGYTHDCLAYFDRRVIVGFGAVGSRVSKALKEKGIAHSVVMSEVENLLLNRDGFCGMRIGQFREGLARLWHGVWISDEDSEYPRKNVPLIVSRPRAPRSTLLARVEGIDFGERLHSLKLSCGTVPETRFFSEKVHLAAGVVNNVKILQPAFPIRARFSDHEIGELGDVKTRELVELGLLSRRFGVVWGRKVIQGQHEGAGYLVDFRPKGPNVIGFDAENIYNNRTDQILRKLIKGLSFRMINQALFNKLGISLDVGRFSAVVQAEAPDTITLCEDGSLVRKRLPAKVFEAISDDVARRFTSFDRLGALSMFDAIHVHGGFDLEQHTELANRMRAKELFLHGNVFDGSVLGPFHNTVSMINRELASLADV